MLINKKIEHFDNTYEKEALIEYNENYKKNFMKKLYPILVQIQHLDQKKDNKDSILIVNHLLEEEEDFSEFFKAYNNIEFVPNSDIVQQILAKGLAEN